MAYLITKIPDGDVNLGNQNGEYVHLTPSTSDYPTGGYALIDGVSVQNNANLQQNIDLYQLMIAVPAGGQGGYVPSYDYINKKLKIEQQSAATGPLTEVPASTDLSAFTFRLLLIGR